jgi:tetratricopeptide (TPR) repeat protein
MYMGRSTDAIEAFERAKSIEPFQATTATWLGSVLSNFGPPDRARAEVDRAWELDSSSAVVQLTSSLTAHDDGRPQDALRIIHSAPTRFVLNRGTFAYIFARAGYPDSARATIAEIERRGASEWGDYFNLSFAALGLRDTSLALDALEKAHARGEPVAGFWPYWTKMFDGIRGSSRFIAFMRRLGVQDVTTPARVR